MSTEPFHQVADLFPEALLLVSGDGVVVAANRAVEERLGLSPDGLPGRRLSDVAADAPDAVSRYLRACSRSKQMVLGFLRVSTREGREVPCRCEGAVYRPRSDDAPAVVLLRLVPRPSAVGQFVALNQRIEELSREILRRQRAEAEAREQREWLQVVLSSIGDAVIAADARGRVSFMNPVAESMTGWPLREATGRPLEDVFRIINEETRGPAESPAPRVLREGTIVGLANHTVLVAKDGSESPIDDCAAPIRPDGVTVAGVVLVFHDVTERRNLERELSRRNALLVEADRRKDEFLAMLAHELRNPLAPVRNGLEVLRLSAGEPRAVEKVREMMDRQVQHLTRLVDDLLDVSRITRGKIQLRQESASLAAVLERAVETIRPLMEQRSHELTVSPPPESVRVDADVVRLAQVFINLLTNAAKFTEPGGRVVVATEPDGDAWLVRVRDTGVGMPPELIPQVFELFTQAERSLDRTQGGLGVGLSVVRSLVTMHGGTVSAHSHGAGKGSEFVVRLPVLPERSVGGSEAAEDGRGRTAAPRRVLVVDDLRDSAESLALLLRLTGYTVFTAFDGPSALEAVGAYRPEIVLLDIGLPGMNGYETARRLRELPGGNALLLVATTGYGQDEDRRQAREAGFDHHLTKPIDVVALRALLARQSSGG